MRICHCYGITDRDLAAAVRSAAQDDREGASALLAGNGCGGCLPLVEAITNKVLAECADEAVSCARAQVPILRRSEETGFTIQATMS